MNANQLTARARELASVQDFCPESLDVNTQLLALRPGDTAARLRLARCQEAGGNWDIAAALYEAVLVDEPQNRIASNRLVDARVQMKFPGIRLDGYQRPRTPSLFEGFGMEDFAELAVTPGDPTERFVERFLDLGQTLNKLPFAGDVQAIRGGTGGLFHRGRTVFGQAGHVYTYHWGADGNPNVTSGCSPRASGKRTWCESVLGSIARRLVATLIRTLDRSVCWRTSLGSSKHSQVR